MHSDKCTRYQEVAPSEDSGACTQPGFADRRLIAGSKVGSVSVKTRQLQLCCMLIDPDNILRLRLWGSLSKLIAFIGLHIGIKPPSANSLDNIDKSCWNLTGSAMSYSYARAILAQPTIGVH